MSRFGERRKTQPSAEMMTTLGGMLGGALGLFLLFFIVFAQSLTAITISAAGERDCGFYRHQPGADCERGCFIGRWLRSTLAH